jgi:acyl transferase domain-containing protein/NADPH:quinone reductase-like Zn-dependent oxidoreductase/SAM-dependent methyltransferase/acyl carrier protein
MGCRFPGNANSPEEFWKLLCAGVDPIRIVPMDRWDLRSYYDPNHSAPGKLHSQWGGFVQNIDQFDADFFGISPREAARMDPQHRLLLEVAYEALEDAGLVPEQLAGSNAGVFIGISTCDYGAIQASPSERDMIDAYTNIGLGFCIAANRISHQFDLHGPSLAIDTACSSSLVAAHLACQAIWNGECDLALVGGANALLRPESTIGFSKASMLAPDGRCKSFDARGDGYVRSEGAGIIVLKSLSSALADRDPVYATVRGTMVNQDGRTPGLALPSGAAQETLLRAAYQMAEISPKDVHFIEAHGTGTPAGDPIELGAIGAVLGVNRAPGDECVVGSVKSNIGHLEAASGVAGLIKAALCIKHGAIPPNLHFETPNPAIAFEALKLRVPQVLESWSANGSARLAGVNSFGFGGTNAHVILGAAPPTIPPISANPSEEALGERANILRLSARSSQALEAMAKSYSAFLASEENADTSIVDTCYSAALRRGHANHRLTVVGNSKQDFIEQLDAFAAGEGRLSMASGRRSANRSTKLAFVFSGMGPQWAGMGRQLIQQEPIFREVVERCDDALRGFTGWSLLEELAADDAHSRIHETQITQPAIFAIQAALTALWRSWGVEPDMIIGHSVGEIAAAHVAGILSLDDATRLVYHRSRLQKRTVGQGEMLAVSLPPREVESLLQAYDESVSIAAINSPEDVTLSGDAAVLRAIAASLEERQVFCRFLQVEVPYHSSRMDPLKHELLESLAGIRPKPATVPMYSTTLNKIVAGPELDAAYWWRNIRNAVQFADAVDEAIRSDHCLFLEIGPHPTLSGAIAKCLSERKKEGSVVASLRRNEPDRMMILSALGKLYTLGYSVDWQRQFTQGHRFAPLPSYPWQRERHWHESEETRRDRIGLNVHPLLGRKSTSAYPAWAVEIDTQRLPYLAQHCVQDVVLYPAAAYVEMALAAARESFGPGPSVIEDLALERAIVIPSGVTMSMQFIQQPAETAFDIYSRVKGGQAPWVRHASGKLRRRQEGEVPKQLPLQEIRGRCRFEILKDDFYQRFHKAGIEYGPSFQGVQRLWCGEGEALGHLELPPELEAELHDYLLHPAILDSCFQMLAGAVALEALQDPSAAETGSNSIYLPVRIGHIRYYGRSAKTLMSYARLVDYTAKRLRGDIQLLDEEGNVLVEILGLECRAIPRPSEKIDSYLYEEQWKLQARAGQTYGFRSGDYMLSPLQIANRLQPEGERLREEFGRDRCEAIEPEVRLLANAYFLASLERLGWKFEVNQSISADALIQELSIAPDHRRLLERTLDILGEDSFVAMQADGWKVQRLPDATNPNEVWSSLWGRFPSMQSELMLVRQCGERLAEILKGEIDPLEAIFPQGSVTMAEHLYQDAPSYRIYNILAQKAVAIALERLPDDRTIRILEIGGGTGGMTAYVLRKLPPDRTEYVFSDVTQFLTGQAEQKFRDFSFVRYQLLDIETDPVAQGYEPHSFDMVLASDVLHATRDLRDSLKHVKQLLASNGLLVFLELTNPPRWIVLVFGLLKGWWRFTDLDLRPKDPCISQQAWREVLREVGFTDVACIADTIVGEKAEHSVIVAQGPVIEREQTAEAQESGAAVTGTWLIFADRRGVGDSLADQLKARGARTVIVSAGDSFDSRDADRFQVRPNSKQDLQLLIDAVVDSQTELRGVVHLWSLDATPPEETTLASMDSAQVMGCLNVLLLIHVLEKMDRTCVPRLWLITGGAQAVGCGVRSVSFTQAPLWGLCRTITNEHPDLRASVIDLSADPTPVEVQSLFDELLADDKEDELALRGPSRYVHRLSRVSLATIQEAAQQMAPVEASAPFYVEIANPGILDSLTLRGCDSRPLAQGEVEIQVIAAALNFRDIMLAMGLLPDEAVEGGSFGRALGMECSGRISRVGEGVEGFKAGDRVVTCAAGALRNYLIADAASVAHMPPHLSFEEGATIPIAFTTAFYALHHLGRMAKGERVLIHAATGGVGLAAIQLAQQAGAEIYATAGTPVKRDLLRALGVSHVADSRSLSFADQILAETGGAGVDIVLNSLAGEAIAKSFSALGSYGRFIEIGKRDIFENSKIELRPFRNNLSYFGVDLDRVSAERPDFVRTLMQAAIDEFAGERLHPLAYRLFPISEIVNAFRYMAQAKHIGKVVVSFAECDVVVTPAAKKELAFNSNATYLITGGAGGFGLAVARWMADHGARHLVLMGRSGASPEAADAIKMLSEIGVHVVAARADVTQEREVETVLADIARTGPPLKGVVHAAMVLDDALLHEFDEERMRRAMWPKAAGAWILHKHTRELPLDTFVMFSSFSSIIGTAKQGNYVAGNTFLDSLAHHRRAQGLAALTINWGVVADTGYVARNADLIQKLDQLGFSPLPAQQMLDMLGALLQENAAQVGVGNLNWQRLAKIPMIGSSPRFTYLVKPILTDDDRSTGAWLIDSIMAVDPADRQSFLQNHVREQLARVLDTSPSKIDIDTPLISLGLDSLMAVEIGHRVQSQLGVSIPAVKFLEGMTTAGMAQYLIEHLAGGQAAAVATDGAKSATASQRQSGDSGGTAILPPPLEAESELSATNGFAPAAEQPATEDMEAFVDRLSDLEVDAVLRRLSDEENGALPSPKETASALVAKEKEGG